TCAIIEPERRVAPRMRAADPGRELDAECSGTRERAGVRHAEGRQTGVVTHRYFHIRTKGNLDSRHCGWSFAAAQDRRAAILSKKGKGEAKSCKTRFPKHVCSGLIEL